MGRTFIAAMDHFLEIWNQCYDTEPGRNDQSGFVWTHILGGSMRPGE